MSTQVVSILCGVLVLIRRTVLRQYLISLRALFLLLVVGGLLAACGGTATTSGGSTTATATTAPKTATLNVFAAASLTESFKEIGKNFEAAHNGVTVKFNFAGSQALVQQITSGAAADVFASADQTNMKKATDAGLVDAPQVFAKNRLIVITPTNNPKVTSLKDLATKGIKIDIGASSVPAGKYSLQVLDKMGKSSEFGSSYESAVKANIVSQEDNVKAVVTKVQLGEVDAGFVYLTDATSAVGKVKEITIPDTYNVIAEYPIAATKSSKDATDAQAFVQYVLSSDGQSVLQKYRFLSPSA